MRSRRRIKISNIIGLFLITASFITATLTFSGFVQKAFAGCLGDGCTDDGGQITRPCKTGNCASVRKNGAFWIAMPATSDDINPASIFGLVYSGTHITGCATHGGTAYILVTPLSGGGLAGPVDIDTVRNFTMNEGGASIPAGSTVISNAQANAQFEAYHDVYAAQGQSYNGTHLGWFCADPTTTTTTTSPPPPPDNFKCQDVRSLQREWGETLTRIAVRNRSLDDPVRDDPKNWRPANSGSPRYPLNNDSGWSEGGASVLTIAKPGDSIQFLHGNCLFARYVRRTTHQSVYWTGHESHNVQFPIPTDHFHIGANVEPGYLFGNAIDWANANGASRSEYGPPEDSGPFPYNPGIPGLGVDPRAFGFQLVSPSTQQNAYDCMGVGQFAALDPYVRNASYQIPGFDSIPGSCNSANLSGVSNPVGSTITQWHKFNRIKAWEQHTTDYGGSCGCNVHDAHWDGHTFSPEYGKPRAVWGYKRDHKCIEPQACSNCCGPCIAGYYDEYNNWHCTSWQYHSWNYTPESSHWAFQSKSKDYGVATKTASVYIPYNFNTSVNSTLDAGDVIFQGSAISSNFSWDILPRSNPKLANWDFATVTPSWTEARMIEFIYDPNDHNVVGNPMTTADPCSYYYGSGAINCKIIKNPKKNWNPYGLYDGQRNGDSATRAVPDDSEYIGFKYCVAMGIYPADSHDGGGNALWQQHSGGYQGAMDAGQYWNISNASCRTIAKKPNFQVWNGSVYTEGGIMTSVTKKMLNVSLGNNYNSGATRLFGSWADYAIEAKGTVKGMASGAMLGYNNGAYDLRAPGGQPAGTSYKKLNPMSIANTAGGSSAVGGSNVSAMSSIKMNLQRLKSRYSEKAYTFAKKDGGYSQKSIRTSETGMQYVYYSGDAKLSELTSNIKSYGSVADHPNQTTHKSGNGLYKTVGDGVNDNTLVIYVGGKLTIDGDICLGNGCSSGMKLSEYSNGTNVKSAAELPQVLIFAGNIAINENVTRIDAWLVVENGEINTCNGYSVGGNLAAHDGYNRYGWGNCYKTLVVNGPIYAKSLTLNRTAGSYHGGGEGSATGALSDVRNRKYGSDGAGDDANQGSISPAEIFNLRADVYLWAYNQAQRYSEAVVTYTRELAPRY